MGTFPFTVARGSQGHRAAGGAHRHEKRSEPGRKGATVQITSPGRTFRGDRPRAERPGSPRKEGEGSEQRRDIPQSWATGNRPYRPRKTQVHQQWHTVTSKRPTSQTHESTCSC